MSNRGRKNTKNEEVEQTQEMNEEETQSRTKTTKGKTAAKKSAGKTSSSKTTKSAQERSKKSSNSKSAKPARGGSDKDKERYFKLIDAKTGRSFGRYTGDTPKQAASKGYTKMLQKLRTEGKNPPKQSTIYLRESTRGSLRKVYGYEASRQKLPEPQELVIEDKVSGEKKTIVYHYRNKIKKVVVPEQIGGAKTSRSGKKSSSTKKGASGSKKGTTGKSADTKKQTKTVTKKTSTKISGSKKGSSGKSAPAKKAQSAKASSSR